MSVSRIKKLREDFFNEPSSPSPSTRRVSEGCNRKIVPEKPSSRRASDVLPPIPVEDENISKLDGQLKSGRIIAVIMKLWLMYQYYV